MKSYKTIATFFYPHEAHVALAKLEAAAFEARLKNENITKYR